MARCPARPAPDPPGIEPEGPPRPCRGGATRRAAGRRGPRLVGVLARQQLLDGRSAREGERRGIPHHSCHVTQLPVWLGVSSSAQPGWSGTGSGRGRLRSCPYCRASSHRGQGSGPAPGWGKRAAVPLAEAGRAAGVASSGGGRVASPLPPPPRGRTSQACSPPGHLCWSASRADAGRRRRAGCRCLRQRPWRGSSAGRCPVGCHLPRPRCSCAGFPTAPPLWATFP